MKHRWVRGYIAHLIEDRGLLPLDAIQRALEVEFKQKESKMLVLSRKKNESILIGDMESGEMVTVVVVEIRGDKVRLGIDAPNTVAVHRREIYEAIRAERERKQSREDEKPTLSEDAGTEDLDS